MAKYQVELNDQLNRVVDDLAAAQKIPKTQVILRAIAVLKYLDDDRRHGNRTFIVTPAGKLDREIVLS